MDNSTHKRDLSEMSLEELWRLFPIVLTEHNPSWANWYEEEARNLKSVLFDGVELYHIGSTSVDGISAKPIIDVLVVVDCKDKLESSASILQNQGYLIMSKSDSRISLNKGYTPNGFADKVFHVHIRLQGDSDEIYFRDYLNSHPQVAKEYEQLKKELSEIYKYNRDAYTQAKTEFVSKYTDIAKRELKTE